MRCKKCGGVTAYQPPEYPGDVASIKCILCGWRDWDLPNKPKDKGGNSSD